MGSYTASAYLHLDRIAEVGLGRSVHEREGDTTSEDRREVAAGHRSDLPTPGYDLSMIPERLAAFGHNPPEDPSWTRPSLCPQRVASTEAWLVPSHAPSQPGLERGDAGTKLMTVERQARFEAKRVSRP